MLFKTNQLLQICPLTFGINIKVHILEFFSVPTNNISWVPFGPQMGCTSGFRMVNQVRLCQWQCYLVAWLWVNPYKNIRCTNQNLSLLMGICYGMPNTSKKTDLVFIINISIVQSLNLPTKLVDIVCTISSKTIKPPVIQNIASWRLLNPIY